MSEDNSESRTEDHDDPEQDITAATDVDHSDKDDTPHDAQKKEKDIIPSKNDENKLPDHTLNKLHDLREGTTFLPDKADTQRECTCSDQDFVRLIASDSSVLCKTINKWQQSYKLDVNDLKEKALRLIKGDFRDLYGDLDPEEQEKIEREIARLQRERTELLMGAIGRMAVSKENTLT